MQDPKMKGLHVILSKQQPTARLQVCYHSKKSDNILLLLNIINEYVTKIAANEYVVIQELI